MQFTEEAFAQMRTIGQSYGPGPYEYTRAEDVVIEFESEAAAIEPLLPPGFTSDGGRAFLQVSRHAASSFGPYTGAYLGVCALHEDQPVRLLLSGVKNDWMGTIAGREIWGFPLTVGDVEIKWEGSGLVGTVGGQAGTELAAFTLHLTSLSEPTELTTLTPTVYTAVERDFEGNERTVLLTARSSFSDAERQTWNAEATLELGRGTAFDDWSLLPVRAVTGAGYQTGGQSVLNPPTVLKKL